MSKADILASLVSAGSALADGTITASELGLATVATSGSYADLINKPTSYSGTFTGTLTGNASTATALQTARTINGVSFDGTGNITVHTQGTGITISGTSIAIDTSVTVDRTTAQTLVNKTLSNPIISGASITGHLIPATNITYDLGSSTNRFRDLYLSGNTITLGTATMSASASGGVSFSNISLTGSTSGTVTVTAPAVAGTTAISFPATNGTVVTTGDTGTVTNAMLAGSITTNKITGLATVATSGAYADLTGKPTLFSGAYADLTGKPTLFSGAYADLTGTPSLATVATSGSYNDLTNKPTLFSGSYTDLTDKPTASSLLPTQTGNSGKYLTTDGTTLSWGTVSGGGGGGGTTVTISDTAPSAPTSGTKWINSITGVEYTYMVDADSGQWVDFGNTQLTPAVWSSILNTPTTLSGYGITDALNIGGTTSTVPNILNFTYTGTGSNSTVNIGGYNSKGGTGYHDFLKVTNGYGSATNPSKWFRLNGSGTLEILNSAYTTTLLSLDDSGNVVTNGYGVFSANRPAFRVIGSGTTNNLTTTQNTYGALNSNNWTVEFNQGTAGLNSTTGVFTAPVAGLYQINIVARNSGYSAGISQLGVMKNGTSGGLVGGTCICMIEFAASSTMNHVGASTVIKLAVNDTLVIKTLAGQINFDGNDNWSVAFIG